MARPAASHIYSSLTSVLPRRRIRDLARQLGVVRRRRKLDIVAFVYSLVLGFGDGDRRTLSGLRRAYLRATGSAPSSPTTPSDGAASPCTTASSLSGTDM